MYIPKVTSQSPSIFEHFSAITTLLGGNVAVLRLLVLKELSAIFKAKGAMLASKSPLEMKATHVTEHDRLLVRLVVAEVARE